MIKTSAPFVSGVVFSGGEPTMQREALLRLARISQEAGLAVGLQTNGFFPETIEELIEKGCIDRIAIDYKTRWEQYPERGCSTGSDAGYTTVPKEHYQVNVRRSIAAAKRAWKEGRLKELEIVVTVFAGNERDVEEIAGECPDIPLVLQQGEHKIAAAPLQGGTTPGGTYISRKQDLQRSHPPLTYEEITKFASGLGRSLRIRTRSTGETVYEGNRSRRPARKRKR
jgi:pyruvate formate lyase activating enzyme